MLKFMVVDDHPGLLEGVAAQLKRLEADVLVFRATTGEQGVELATGHDRLDATLVALDLGGHSGLLLVKALRRARASLPVLVISGTEEAADVRASIAAGAQGYCPKSSSSESLLAAVRLVMSGQIYLPPLMLNAPPGQFDDPAAGSPTRSGPKLTHRQVEVLREICEGHPNKQIARRLGMEEKTVKTHVTQIFKRMGVANRVQAAVQARSAGLAR